MKHTLLALLCFVVLSLTSYAQQAIPAEHQKVFDEYIAAYNAQDFKKLRECFGGVLKALFTEKRLEQIFSMQYAYSGSARIHRIVPRSSTGYTLELAYSKDPTEIQKTGISFNKKNKIAGMGSSSEKMQYAKTPQTKSLANEDLKFKIDSMLHIKHELASFTGCVLVVKDKQTVYQDCIGERDYNTHQPLDEHSVFELASCSKAFTAMAIMILQEQGKLQYNDLIEKYLPGLPYKNVTIEHLLTHTGGIPDYMELLDKHWDKTKSATNNDIVEMLKKHKPKKLFKPGKKYEYSNTGYALLALIVEKASGQTFGHFLAAHIFQPLEMKDSRIYNTRRTQKEIIANYAYGYVYSDSLKHYTLPDSLPDYDYVTYMDAIMGDGIVNTSISDMAKWVNALREYKLVKKETFDRAVTPYQLSKKETSNYGYGWEIQPDAQYEALIHHSGSWPGYITYVVHFLDKELSVVILTNSEYFNIQKMMNKIILMAK